MVEETRIYVGNLPSDKIVRTEDIEDLFKTFGKVVYVEMNHHRRPPFAFVTFADPKIAKEAVQARNGYKYDGRKLRVEFPRGRGSGLPNPNTTPRSRIKRESPLPNPNTTRRSHMKRESPLPNRNTTPRSPMKRESPCMDEETGTRIYVGNLPTDKDNIQANDIKDLFKKFGKIVYVEYTHHKQQTFAYVTFDDPKNAKDAVQARDGFYYNGHKLKVNIQQARDRHSIGFQSRNNSSSSRGKEPSQSRYQYRVVVSGLHPSGSLQDLKDHMHVAGDVGFVNINKDGTGVVEFLCYEHMKKALKTLDNTIFCSHTGETSLIQVKNDLTNSGGCGQSLHKRRSRSNSPRNRGSPTYSAVQCDYSHSKTCAFKKFDDSIFRPCEDETSCINVNKDYTECGRGYDRSMDKGRSRSRSCSPTNRGSSTTYSPVQFDYSRSKAYAFKKLNDSRSHSNEGETSYIRVNKDYTQSVRGYGRSLDKGSFGKGRSRSRSYSPRNRRSPTFSPERRDYSRSKTCALKKFDDSRFCSNEDETSYIPVNKDYTQSVRGNGRSLDKGSFGKGRSRSRSYSPRNRRSPTFSSVRRDYSMTTPTQDHVPKRFNGSEPYYNQCTFMYTTSNLL